VVDDPIVAEAAVDDVVARTAVDEIVGGAGTDEVAAAATRMGSFPEPPTITGRPGLPAVAAVAASRSAQALPAIVAARLRNGRSRSRQLSCESGVDGVRACV
jgi:hypothetical protein